MSVSLQYLQATLSGISPKKFEKELDLYKGDFERMRPELDSAVIQFASEYIEAGNQWIADKKHYKSNRTAKWMHYDFRYGYTSIVGKRCELFAVWLWNKKCKSETRLVFGPETKEAQKSGIDVIFEHPDWQIGGQVKQARLEKAFAVPESIQRCNPKQVGRVIFTDLKRGKLLAMDINLLLRLCYSNHVIKTIRGVNGSKQWYWLLPVDVALKTQWTTFMEITK